MVFRDLLVASGFIKLSKSSCISSAYGVNYFDFQ